MKRSRSDSPRYATLLRLTACIAATGAIASWGGCRRVDGAGVSVNGMTVRDAAAPAPLAAGDTASATAAVYLTMVNARAADTLDSVTTPIAKTAAVHTEMQHGGMMAMMPMPALEIPAHDSVRLSPGTRHIMLERLTHLPRAGDLVSLTLHFRHAGAITVEVPVVPYADVDSVLGVRR